ncbi:metallophosphoesterase family protein [Pseudoduganella namucuonensis]|uniref:Calcineurin-like phosphoesterase n=1 Tax=Pseudoduganella namucuonensis TaxID=1035707 RepID=A0A1I7M2Z5_9BURK|nr:metallophosphoesterase [Pseudoduganella namucuonensis]SFV16275.1 Calcineurin-like phosphoesterase [Pseudoduganella namucuonensis]
MATFDFEPFLHIVHVSDMHYRDGGAPTDQRADDFVRLSTRVLRRFGWAGGADALMELWDQGVAGHDYLAHREMCRFLYGFAANPQFGGVETWLLDTGDLSAMGDMESLRSAMGCLRKYRTLLRASQWLVLYGNHDAWPAKFPLGVDAGELERHRSALRNGIFPPRWPQGPLSIAIPHSASRLLLQGVNSAIDDQYYNWRALGRVGCDPPWAPGEASADQLDQLASGVERGFHPDGRTRDFRILALHHPVHYPPPRPWWTMSLMNDRDVARSLIRFDHKRRGKLAHLVLSGHTHETYPPVGKLPASANAISYGPLADGQVQLIANSLSQVARSGNRAGRSPTNYVPNGFQILTFLAAPDTAGHELLLERRVIGRPGGVGEYEILYPNPARPEVEAIAFHY